MIQQIRQLKEDSQGLSTVEYIIILVLIAVVSMGLWQIFGEKTSEEIVKSENAFSMTVGAALIM